MPSRKGRTSEEKDRALHESQTALQVSETRLRAVLENSHDVVLLANSDGTFSYCHAWPIYGLSPDAVVGRTASEVFPGPTAAILEARLRHVFTTGLPLTVDEEMDIGGRRLWLTQQYRPVRGPRGWVDSVSVTLKDVDQTKRAEEVLRESEERHRQMYEGNPLPMMVFDSQTLRFLSVNEAALAHYGYSREEFLRMSIPDIRPAEDVPAVLENIRTRPAGMARPGVRRHVKRNGEVISVEVVSHSISFEGRPAWLVLCQDVTERIRTQQLLRDSEALLADVFESVHDGMIVLGPDLTILKANPVITRLFAHRSPLVGRKCHEALHGMDAPCGCCQTLAAMRGDPTTVAEKTVVLPDGSTRALELHSVPLGRTPGQAARGAVELVRDITLRVQSERKLSLQRSRLELHNRLYRAILDGLDATNVLRRSLEAAEGVLPCERVSYTTWDPVRRVCRVVLVKTATGFDEPDREIPFDEGNRLHQQMEALFARNQHLYLGDIERYGGLPADTGQHMAEGFRSVVFQPVVDRGETLGLLAFWSRLPDAFSGEMLELIATLAETLLIAFEKHRLNQQIRHHTIHLEEQVALRTRELQAAYDELESFTYTVTHDLRAPLRALQGFAQVLLKGYSDRLDETGRGYLQFVGSSAQRMDTLILDLLAYSRLGHTLMKHLPLELGVVVKDALEDMSAAILESRADIRLDIPDLRVLCHRQTLMQAVNNLVANAIKFVEPGKTPELTIVADRLDGFARLSVSDNGIGIAREHQERIFNVFERLHGYEDYPGTGIGLAIAKRAVERMNGRIGVESEQGSGSRFWIELPLAGDMP